MLEFIIVPFTNALIFIYSILGENFGLAIIIFTVIVRLATYPFTASQLKSTKAMQELQNNKIATDKISPVLLPNYTTETVRHRQFTAHYEGTLHG